MIPARKQRCAPYDVDKVYFFAVQCRISSATKTSVNGPSRLTSEAVIKRSISYKLSVTSYKKPKYRIQIIINYKLQITNYKKQITSYKLQVTNYKIQITEYKKQIANYKLQIASYKLQITNYKLQVANYKLQVTNYKLQNYKL